MAVSEDKVTLFFIVVVISVILLANSFGVLSPLEHGFVQRWPSNQLDRTRVYKSGRYFLGLGNYFVKFPATARRLDFTASGRSQISAATKDQLSVGIDMTVYYKLKNTANGELIALFDWNGLNDAYHEFFRQSVTSVVKQTTVQYHHIQYFENRTKVRDAIKNAVADVFSARYCEMAYLHLRAIDLPDTTENAIIDKLVKAQDAITESKSRSAQLVRQDTKTIDAVANAQVTVNLATARANGKVQLAQKTAQGTKTVQEAKYSGVSALAKQLGLSAKDLNRFLYLRSLRMQGKGTALMVDVADRTVMTKELR